MAGVTNVAFRTLCRELEQQKAGTVSGLYVCEMVTARALVERHPVTMHMTTFAPDESPRSLQLYTVDPKHTYDAAKMIVEENLADHIDMNFGCPVPKVTRRGGGAALPYKRRLFGQIVAAAVRATEGTDIPVTAATAAPPEDPPGVRAGSHGLRVSPVRFCFTVSTEPSFS